MRQRQLHPKPKGCNRFGTKHDCDSFRLQVDEATDPGVEGEPVNEAAKVSALFI